MYKILKITIYALGVLGVILFGGILFSNVDPWANYLFSVAYVLLACALLAVAFYGLANIFSSSHKLKKTLLYTGVFLAIILLSYVMASSEEEMVGKMVVTGIYAVYILGVIATALMVVSGVKKALIK